MKRLTTLILTVLLVIGLVACDNSDIDTTKEANHGEVEETNNTDIESEITETETTEEIIFEQTLDSLVANNYRFPTDFDFNTLNDEFCGEIFNHILTSVKTLDADAIKPFITSEEKWDDYRYYFDLIKSNEEALDVWNNTIGLIEYFPVSDVIVGKNIDYVQSMWYTDCVRNNVVLEVEDIADLPKETIFEIYENYYVDAPMIAAHPGSETLYVNDDNYVKCDIDNIFEILGYPEMHDMMGVYDSNLNYSKFIMGEEDCLALGYDYIHQDILCVDSLLNKDLSEMIELTKTVEEKHKSGLSWECFEKYYLDETNLAIINQFLQDECIVTRDLSAVYIFMPSDFSLYPLYNVHDGKEIDEINSREYTIMYQERMYDFPGNFGNSFSAFYNLVELMKAKGYFAE